MDATLPLTSDHVKGHKDEVMAILEEIEVWGEMQQNFSLPVSKKVYPTYYEIIQNPTDLGKIIKSFKSNKYDTVDALIIDLQLIFDNCRQFNDESSDIVGSAKRCEEKLAELFLAKFRPSGNLQETFLDSTGARKAPKPISLSSAAPSTTKRGRGKKMIRDDDDDGEGGYEEYDPDDEDWDEGAKPKKRKSTGAAAAAPRGKGRPTLADLRLKEREGLILRDATILARSPLYSANGELLLPPNTLRKIVRRLMESEHAAFFTKPVNEKAFPDYEHLDLNILLGDRWCKQVGGGAGNTEEVIEMLLSGLASAAGYHVDSGIGAQASSLEVSAKHMISAARVAFAADVADAAAGAAAPVDTPAIRAAREAYLKIENHGVLLGDHGIAVLKLLKALNKQKHADAFFSLHTVPDAAAYVAAVKEPMDLRTIEDQVESYGNPCNIAEFARDVRLVFSNALTFRLSDEAAKWAETLLDWFEKNLVKSFPATRQDAPRPSRSTAPKAPKAEKAQAQGKGKNAVEKKEEVASKAPSFEKLAKETGFGRVFGKPMSTEQIKTLQDHFAGLSPAVAAKDPIVQARARELVLKVISEPLESELPLTIGASMYEVSNWGSVSKVPNCVDKELGVFYPDGFAVSRSLRLAVVPTAAPASLSPEALPFVQVELTSSITYAPDSPRPSFEVRLTSGPLVAKAASHKAAWAEVLGKGQQVLHLLGSKLRRCRAVLNRIAVLPDAAPFLESPVSSFKGAELTAYEAAVVSPMWLREVHARISGGLYDNEFDFVWDMRQIFTNATEHEDLDEGSPKRQAAVKLEMLFSHLLSDWVINPADKAADDLALGPWDDWKLLPALDAAATNNVCGKSGKSAAAKEFAQCCVCKQQYIPSALAPETNVAPSVKGWECKRCAALKEEYPVPIAPGLRDINYTAEMYSSGNTYVPAPEVGPGWYVARVRSRNNTKKSWLSPLGYPVQTQGPTDGSGGGHQQLINSQKEFEAEIAKDLIKDEATKYAASRGKPAPKLPSSSSSSSPDRASAKLKTRAQLAQHQSHSNADHEDGSGASKGARGKRVAIIDPSSQLDLEPLPDDGKMLVGVLVDFQPPKNRTLGFFCNKDDLTPREFFLAVNERVLGLWKGTNWFKGVVKANNPDGTYHIRYDDGDEERRVPFARLRLLSNVGAVPTKAIYPDSIAGGESCPVGALADYMLVTPESLPCTGFFGLHLKEMRIRLEAQFDATALLPLLPEHAAEAEPSPGQSSYVHAFSTTVYEEGMSELEAAKEVSRLFAAAEEAVLNEMHKERFYWAAKREEDRKAAAAEGRAAFAETLPDLSLPPPNRAHGAALLPLFDTLVKNLPIHAQTLSLPREQQELLLVLWDTLDLIRPSVGDLCLTLQELVESLAPPTGKFTTMGQLVFDSASCTLTQLLLLENAATIRTRAVEEGLALSVSSDEAGGITQDVFFYRPLNILTWPEVARSALLCNVAPISYSDGLNAARFSSTGLAAVWTDVIVLLLRHPSSYAFEGTTYGETLPSLAPGSGPDVVDATALDAASASSMPARDLRTVRNRCVFNLALLEGRFYQGHSDFVTDVCHAVLLQLKQYKKAPGGSALPAQAKDLLNYLASLLPRLGVSPAECDVAAARAKAQATVDRTDLSHSMGADGSESPPTRPATLGLLSKSSVVNALTLAGLRYQPPIGWDGRVDEDRTATFDEELQLLAYLETTLLALRSADPDAFSQEQRAAIYATLLDSALRSGELLRCVRGSGLADSQELHATRAAKERDIADVDVVTAIPNLVLEAYRVPRGSGARCHFTNLRPDMFPAAADVGVDTEAGNVALVAAATASAGTEKAGSGPAWVVVPEWLLQPPVPGDSPFPTVADKDKEKEADSDRMDLDEDEDGGEGGKGGGRQRPARAKAHVSYTGGTGTKRRTQAVALEIVVRRIVAARLKALQEVSGSQGSEVLLMLDMISQPETANMPAGLAKYRQEGHTSRRTAVGTCMRGWSYWVLGAQERSSLFGHFGSFQCRQMSQRAAAPAASIPLQEHEPALVVFVPDARPRKAAEPAANDEPQPGWHVIMCGSNPTSAAGLLRGILDQGTGQSKQLFEALVMRLTLTYRSLLADGFMRASLFAQEFHARRERLEQQLVAEEAHINKTGLGVLFPTATELTNRMEAVYARFCDARVLTLLGHFHRDEDLLTPGAQQNRTNWGQQAKTSTDKLAKIHRDQLLNTLDSHPSRGYLRPDAVSKVLMLHPSLTVSRMFAEPHLAQWLREVETRCIFKTGQDVFYSFKSFLPPAGAMPAEAKITAEQALQCWKMSRALMRPGAPPASALAAAGMDALAALAPGAGGATFSAPAEAKLAVETTTAPAAAAPAAAEGSKKRPRGGPAEDESAKKKGKEVSSSSSSSSSSSPTALVTAPAEPGFAHSYLLRIPVPTVSQHSEFLIMRSSSNSRPAQASAEQQHRPISEVSTTAADGTVSRHRKPVEMLHMITEEPLRLFESQAAAASFINVLQGGITQACTGSRPSHDANGFKWRFYTGPPLDLSQASLSRIMITAEEAKALQSTPSGWRERAYVDTVVHMPPKELSEYLQALKEQREKAYSLYLSRDSEPNAPSQFPVLDSASCSAAAAAAAATAAAAAGGGAAAGKQDAAPKPILYTERTLAYPDAPSGPGATLPRVLLNNEHAAFVAGGKVTGVAHPWCEPSGASPSALNAPRLKDHLAFSRPLSLISTCLVSQRLAKLKQEAAGMLLAAPDKLWKVERERPNLFESCLEVSFFFFSPPMPRPHPPTTTHSPPTLTL